jgi:hypothetical protein
MTIKRLGATFTLEELNVWKQRFITGPYRALGDISTNSPGEWSRILTNATQLVTNPSIEKWDLPTQYIENGVTKNITTTYIPKWAVPDPVGNHIRTSNAAFVYLVSGHTAYLNAAKTSLFLQIDDPNMDFSNTTIWKPQTIDDQNPGFIICQMIARLFCAFDFMKHTFTQPEKDQCDEWFLNAATFWAKECDDRLALHFVDRMNENYTLTSYGNAVGDNNLSSYKTHDDGWMIPVIALHHNNRRADMIKLGALVGIHLNNAYLKKSAEIFFKSFMRFQVFPDGLIGEMERGRQAHEKGVSYAGCLITLMADIADVFARSGNTSLYTYSTEEGKLNTVSPGNPKTFKKVVKRYIDIHAPGTQPKIYYDNLLLDGIDAATNWYSVFDVAASATVNLYYKDPAIKAQYMRNRAGSNQYPTTPAGSGFNNGYSGAGGNIPSKLFMYGQLEDVVDPYTFTASGVTSGSTSGNTTGNTSGGTITGSTNGTTTGFTSGTTVVKGYLDQFQYQDTIRGNISYKRLNKVSSSNYTGASVNISADNSIYRYRLANKVYTIGVSTGDDQIRNINSGKTDIEILKITSLYSGSTYSWSQIQGNPLILLGTTEKDLLILNPVLGEFLFEQSVNMNGELKVAEIILRIL